MTEKEIGICKTCGKEFKKNNKLHLYCWDCKHINAFRRNHFMIHKRDNFQCAYCGATSFFGAELHLDHIIPKLDGGEDKAHNLITSCGQCNISKGNDRLSSNIEYLLLSEVEKRNKENKISPDLNITIRMPQ